MSFLSPNGAERLEAAFSRRLDRLSRQVQRLERNVGITIETLAMYVRIWLTVTPPMPTGEARAAMQLEGTKRFDGTALTTSSSSANGTFAMSLSCIKDITMKVERTCR